MLLDVITIWYVTIETIGILKTRQRKQPWEEVLLSLKSTAYFTAELFRRVLGTMKTYQKILSASFHKIVALLLSSMHSQN